VISHVLSSPAVDVHPRLTTVDEVSDASSRRVSGYDRYVGERDMDKVSMDTGYMSHKQSMSMYSDSSMPTGFRKISFTRDAESITSPREHMRFVSKDADTALTPRERRRSNADDGDNTTTARRKSSKGGQTKKTQTEDTSVEAPYASLRYSVTDITGE